MQVVRINMQKLRSETLLLFSCFSLWAGLFPRLSLSDSWQRQHMYMRSQSAGPGGETFGVSQAKFQSTTRNKDNLNECYLQPILGVRPSLKDKQNARLRHHYSHSQSSSLFTPLYLLKRKKTQCQLSQLPGSRKCTELKERCRRGQATERKLFCFGQTQPFTGKTVAQIERCVPLDSWLGQDDQLLQRPVRNI